MGGKFEATNLNLVPSIVLIQNLSQSKEDYLMLFDEEKWKLFEFFVFQLEESPKKTIGSQALNAKDASNDVRPEVFLRATNTQNLPDTIPLSTTTPNPFPNASNDVRPDDFLSTNN